MNGSTLVTIATPDERETAFGIAYGRSQPDQRSRQVERLSTMVERGEFPAAGVFLARRGAKVVGAMLAQPMPGRTAVVCPPNAIDREAEDRLIESALNYLKKQNAHTAQCFLDADETSLAEPLLRHGFRHVTRIGNYLRLTAMAGRCQYDVPTTLRFQSDDVQDRIRFTLNSTYVESLDIPEAFEEMSAEEILTGFSHGPQRTWWLASQDGIDLGVLLIGNTDQPGVGELVYFGVIPEYRGRGIGASVLDFALKQFEEKGIGDVYLSVDERNAPAIRLYESRGFRRFQSQELFLLKF